jgi:hypothetical protein
MRLLACASALSAAAALAAARTLQALVPLPALAPASDDSVAHRVAFAALVLARSHAGRAALAAADAARWLALWPAVSPPLRSSPLALAALSSIVPHLTDEQLAALVAQLAPVLQSVASDAKLSTAILCVLLCVAETRRGGACLVQYAAGEWLESVATRVCTQAQGVDEAVVHLASLVNALPPSAESLASTLRARLNEALSEAAAGPMRALALRLLVGTSKDAREDGQRVDEARSGLPWEMLVDALSDDVCLFAVFSLSPSFHSTLELPCRSLQ